MKKVPFLFVCSRACAYIYYKGIDADSKNQKNNYYL